MTAATWGLLAEFASAEALLDAARRARAAGYGRAEAYAPFPVEGLAEALGEGRPRGVAGATFAGGILGGIGAYALQWYAAVVDYPINVGGRSLHSWPMFVPATFELTVLGAAIAAVAAFLVVARLPELHHPLFGIDEFELATRSRFFLVLRSDDPAFDATHSRAFVAALAPLASREVAAT